MVSTPRIGTTPSTADHRPPLGHRQGGPHHARRHHEPDRAGRRTGRTTPTASASIPTCSSPSGGRRRERPRRCAAVASCASSASSSHSRTARSSASGAGCPSVSGAASAVRRAQVAAKHHRCREPLGQAGAGMGSFGCGQKPSSSLVIVLRPVRRFAAAEAGQEPGQGAEGVQGRARRGHEGRQADGYPLIGSIAAPTGRRPRAQRAD